MTAIVAIAGIACIGIPDLPGTGDDATVAGVAAKAVDVANNVGGAQGYGGTLMNGYGDHMPGQMGFLDEEDLADPNDHVIIRFHNDSDEDGTFHMGYLASHLGLEEQMMDVSVPAGEEIEVELPCSEIVGLGTLDMPGSPGFHFASDRAVNNMMAVPGFLGLDFVCGSTHNFRLTRDIDDLDGDGDTDEWVCASDPLYGHMEFGGPGGHWHGPGGMGGHFGGPGFGSNPPSADSNGESIFLTGRNLDGDWIPFDDGPPWLYRHGGGCASCHGVDGSGGQWVMMSDVIAPDIRYSVLTEGDHDEHGEGEEEEHPPYDDALLTRAIRDGLNPADEELSLVMPRWDLSDEDMADLIEYLKSLDEDGEHQE
jgi:mono/diheme cytochrome c family protein